MQLIVNIDVDDLDAGVDFYSRALGLRLSRRLFDGTVAELAGATSTVHLLLKPAGSSAVADTSLIRGYQRHWTPVHLDFVVENAASAVERALQAGATLEGQIDSFAWGRLAAMSDPFGHGFCLLEFAHGG